MVAVVAALTARITELETLVRSLTVGLDNVKKAQQVPAKLTMDWSHLFDKAKTNQMDSLMPILATMMQREAKSKANKQNSIIVKGLNLLWS